MRRLASLFVVVLVLPVLAACKGNTAAEAGSPVALIDLAARTNGAGYTTAPTANFYRAGVFVPISAVGASDTCQIRPYPAANLISASVISGGAGVVTTIKTAIDTLKRVATADGTYRGATSGLAFTPGDTVTFNILGDFAGFRQATTFGKTAEAFTMSSATPPPGGQNLDLTWSPVASGALMLVSLRYNDGTGTTSTPNAQILCDFVDDGAATVPAALVARWAAGNVAARSADFQRMRTVLARGSDVASFINIRSIFEVPTPVSP